MKNTFTTELIQPNESERLLALRRYKIIGTHDEKTFRNIAKLIADIFNVSIAMISLVEEEDVYFRSSVGMATDVGPRGESFCALTILKPEVNVIEDALENEVVRNNPLVCGAFGLRFYAGAPLITYDGFMIGTVCMVDTKPRVFSKKDNILLEGLANIVMEQIELRLINMDEAEKQMAVNRQLAETNDKIIASERWFQNILDVMAEGVGIVDAKGKLTYSNLMAQHILGLNRQQINDRSFGDLRWQNLRIDGSLLPDEEHPMTVMMRTGNPLFDQEIAVQPPGKERFYISINAAPIKDKITGEITGGIGTFMDVTKRRMVLQQKDEFINVASHELKTPVTSLKAAMEIMEQMKDDIKPEVFAMMIAQSNRSLTKLTGLISDLLDASRISQGRLHLRKKVFQINQLINDCCQHVRLAGKHEIVFEKGSDIEVDADEQQIDQVMVNLVNNAVKYAPESKNIYVVAEKLADAVKITVKDNGPGILPEQLPHLFERYFRADYTGFNFSGLGLGLYISAEIIKKHGGEIGVDSEAGKGSSFWFTLPINAKIMARQLR